MLNHLKTLLILLLATSAVYLTVQLWFSEISGSSFDNALLAFFSRAQPDSEAEQNFFVKPAKIVTAFGDGSYDVIYNNLDASPQKRDCDEAILLALDEGEYIGSAAADPARLLDTQGYAYCYTAAMPATVFINSYPQRRSILTSRVKSFDWVFVKPRSDSGISVIFLDTDSRAHEYRVDNFFLERRISENISGLAADGSRLKYVYDREFFIPQAAGFTYPEVLMENQYMDQGGLLLDYIQRKVDVFFGGAGSKWASSTAQIFTYSDEDTVCKYFPAESQNGLDVLEYANYKVIDRRIMTMLWQDYNAAMRFISRDTAIANEFYLAAVEETGNRRSFYFNCAVNDLPVYISYMNAGQTGLAYPIEIVVENGVVTRYRKLVYKFTASGAGVTAATTFENVLNDLLTVGESPADVPLDAVTLGYKADTNSGMVLYWFLELEGMTYMKSAQGGS